MTVLMERWARWARLDPVQAVANARQGSLECSQRRLERAEVEAYLRARSRERATVVTRRAPA